MSRISPFLCALLVAVGLMADPAGRVRAQSTVPQYETIVDPTVQSGDAALLALTPFSPSAAPSAYRVVMMEAWRLNAMSYRGVMQSQADAVIATGLMAHTIKDLRVGGESEIQGSCILVDKLKQDLKWYASRYSGFASGEYDAGDAAEAGDYYNYTAINHALHEFTYKRQDARTGQVDDRTVPNVEQELSRASEGFINGLMHVEARLGQGRYGLMSMRMDTGYLAPLTRSLQQAAADVEAINTTLFRNGATPRRQLRAVFTNKSTDMLFLVQVMPRDTDGTYDLRGDTAYPIPIYPNVSKVAKGDLQKLQIDPVGQRGASSIWLPVGLRDRLVIRAVTMGQTRDRIHFMVPNGKGVHVDLNSLTRTFYYLGYGIDVPRSRGSIVSRWFPESEKYQWSFGGGWAPGESSNDPALSNTPGASLRGFFQPLDMEHDRMEWSVPASIERASSLEPCKATVEGTAEVVHVGPTSSKRTTIMDSGSGDLQMVLQAW